MLSAMPFYQSIINSHGLHIECEGDEIPLVGFYTGRKTLAVDENTARDKMLIRLQRESRVRQIVRQACEAGHAPTFEVYKIWEISLWAYLFGSYPKGFIFYPASDSGNGEYHILRFP